MAFEMPETKAQPIVPNRIGLIDADCVAYWAAAGCDEMTVDAAKRRCDDRMNSIIDQLQTREIRSYLTGKNNFRNEVAQFQQYKGNRYDANGNRLKAQPKWLAAVRTYLQTDYDAILCEGQEADDALGIAQMKVRASETYHSIISSIDKDLRIIPGLHHDMNSGFIEEIDELGYLTTDKKGKVRGGGQKFFYAQLLMGDSADWIKGLPKVTDWMKETYNDTAKLRKGGCGQKAAYNILNTADTEKELFFRVMSCYASYWDGDHFFEEWRSEIRHYPEPESMLLEAGQLLWMRREEAEMWEYNTKWHEEWCDWYAENGPLIQ